MLPHRLEQCGILLAKPDVRLVVTVLATSQARREQEQSQPSALCTKYVCLSMSDLRVKSNSE